MLRLHVISLRVEIPLHKPVPEYEKDYLVHAMIGDSGYIRILRKAFVIRGDASLIVFNHVVDIRFIRDQACKILAQVAPSAGIPIDEKTLVITILTSLRKRQLIL